MGNKQSGEQSRGKSQQGRPSSNRQPPSNNQGFAPKKFTNFAMGNANAVNKHLSTAEKTGVCQLSAMNLSSLPDDLGKLAGKLRTLDLSQNKLSSLPPYIAAFSFLKNLHLESNQLVSLPEEIGQLKKLESINLSQNRLTAIPQSFGDLRALKSVDLSQNRLAVFPVTMYSLRNLDNVDLSENALTSVPDGVHQLQTIELNLNQNQISVLTEDIASCPRLKVLRLEENCLEKAMITPKILKQSQIALLALDGNLFPSKDFPHFDGYEEYQERFAATKKKMG